MSAHTHTFQCGWTSTPQFTFLYPLNINLSIRQPAKKISYLGKLFYRHMITVSLDVTADRLAAG